MTKPTPSSEGTTCRCHCHYDANGFIHAGNMQGEDVCPVQTCKHCTPPQECICVITNKGNETIVAGHTKCPLHKDLFKPQEPKKIGMIGDRVTLADYPQDSSENNCDHTWDSQNWCINCHMELSDYINQGLKAGQLQLLQELLEEVVGLRTYQTVATKIDLVKMADITDILTDKIQSLEGK